MSQMSAENGMVCSMDVIRTVGYVARRDPPCTCEQLVPQTHPPYQLLRFTTLILVPVTPAPETVPLGAHLPGDTRVPH